MAADDCPAGLDRCCLCPAHWRQRRHLARGRKPLRLVQQSALLVAGVARVAPSARTVDASLWRVPPRTSRFPEAQSASSVPRPPKAQGSPRPAALGSPRVVRIPKVTRLPLDPCALPPHLRQRLCGPREPSQPMALPPVGMRS
jgi:hypothetical protein